MPLEILNYRAHSPSQENANKGVVLSVFIYFKIWLSLLKYFCFDLSHSLIAFNRKFVIHVQEIAHNVQSPSKLHLFLIPSSNVLISIAYENLLEE